ncbi:hypothetical protein AB0H28_29365 [Micromonospora sp. NPDC050980]|uniref:hypothetical protein n=1 Tax=Micromonospora sp. NPDC050980 TaxID=3155161 RepID=UPI0033FCA4B4
MIRVRLVAGDVDELRAAAAAVAQALTVTRTSRPVPRRSGDGITCYLDTELPGRTTATDSPGSTTPVSDDGGPAQHR